MSISFNCPACGKKVKAKEKYAGRQVQCPGCGADIGVPALDPVAAPSSAAAAPSSPAADDDSPSVSFHHPTSWDDGLDMTPMIDVTFLLLIFFTITAAFALQKSIAFPNPVLNEEAPAAQTIKKESDEDDDWVELRIDDESRVWLDDQEAASSQELLRRLQDKVAGSGTDATGMKKLSIVASGESRHERLVMAIDMGTEAGMEEIKVQTLEDE